MDSIFTKKIRELFEGHKSYVYKKRDAIVISGYLPESVNLITKGYIRSYVSSKDGKEFTLKIYKPYDFFPTRASLNEQPTSHSYQALTEVEIVRIPKEDFVSFFKKNNDVLFILTQKLLGNLNETIKRLEVTIMGNARQKVLTILLFLIDNIGEEENGNFTIPIHFSHQEIANMTGLTRETVSIEIEKLKKDKLINQRGRLIIIPDIKKCSELIG